MPPSPDFPNGVRSNSSSSLCGHSRSVLKHELMGFFVVLPVRIELTTSPLPREELPTRIYLTLRSFRSSRLSLGADLVSHAASPAAIDGANCVTFTWA